MNKIIHLGPHVALPLLHHVVVGVHFDADEVKLVLAKDQHGARPTLTIGEAMTLSHHDKRLVDTTEAPLEPTALAEYGELLSLMWTEIVAARAWSHGVLELRFSNELTLIAHATGWSGWQYRGYGESLYGRAGGLR